MSVIILMFDLQSCNSEIIMSYRIFIYKSMIFAGIEFVKLNNSTILIFKPSFLQVLVQFMTCSYKTLLSNVIIYKLSFLHFCFALWIPSESLFISQISQIIRILNNYMFQFLSLDFIVLPVIYQGWPDTLSLEATFQKGIFKTAIYFFITIHSSLSTADSADS